MTRNQSSDSLNMQGYIDYIPKEILEKFSDESSIKMRYDPQEDVAITEFQILTDNIKYDLVILSVHPSPTIQELAKLDRVHSLPSSYEALIPYGTPKELLYRNGKLMCMPIAFGTVDLAYNTGKVQAALGYIPENPLDLVFDLETVERLYNAGISITIVDAPTDVIYALMLYMGIDINNYSKHDLLKACKQLVKLRKFYSKINTLMCISDLQNDMTDIALSWTDILKTGVTSDKYTIVQPTPSVLWMDCVCIPNGAKHYDNACKFIEFLMRPENIATLVRTRRLRERVTDNMKFNENARRKTIYSFWKFWLQLRTLKVFPQNESACLTELHNVEFV